MDTDQRSPAYPGARPAGGRYGDVPSGGDHPSQALAAFAAGLRFEMIPAQVVERAVNLYVDWLGSALAGKGARPVESLCRFARASGGREGLAEIIIDRGRASAYFAAMVNGAASHFVEQDRRAQRFGAASRDGGIPGGAGPGAGAGRFRAGSGHRRGGGLRGGHPRRRIHGALALQGFPHHGHRGDRGRRRGGGTVAGAGCRTHAARLRLGGHPGQRLVGIPARCGRFQAAAYGDGGGQRADGRAAGGGRLSRRGAHPGRGTGHGGGDVARCRPDAPAGPPGAALEPRWRLRSSTTRPAAIRIRPPTHCWRSSRITGCGRRTSSASPRACTRAPSTCWAMWPCRAALHQAKFNMGTVLGIVAHRGYAGVEEFEQGYDAPEIAAFRDKVTMVLDDEVDRAYPARWIGKVSVETTDGRVLLGRVDDPKGDPGNTLSRDEISTKFLRLAAFSGAADAERARGMLDRAWISQRCRRSTACSRSRRPAVGRALHPGRGHRPSRAAARRSPASIRAGSARLPWDRPCTSLRADMHFDFVDLRSARPSCRYPQPGARAPSARTYRRRPPAIASATWNATWVSPALSAAARA